MAIYNKMPALSKLDKLDTIKKEACRVIQDFAKEKVI